MAPASHLEIVPLGGLGEFGMNLMVYRWGDDCLVVDAGMMFPGAEHLGVEVVLPDLSFLEDCGTIHAVLLTHGHEDHIGALSYLLDRHDLPVYSSAFTTELIRRRLAEHGLHRGNNLFPLPEGDGSVELGPFTVQTLPAAHSIPQARMLVLRTPVGIVVHTADFKLDDDPVDGVRTDLDRLKQLGDEGVLALLSDSTNADVPGVTPTERSAGAGIAGLVADAPGRVVVTTFSSHIHRLQQIAAIATRHRRKLAVVGTSMLGHIDVAERLGLWNHPPGLRVSPQAAMSLPPREAMVLVAGSQGEPMSSMTRMAVGRHRDIHVEQDDLVIHSARKIPGNEKSIDRMVNHLLRRGAEVVTGSDAPVHVSGHASSEELGQVLDRIRPRFFIPIHGEYRQLRAHARIARDRGLSREAIQLADSGDVIALDSRGVAVEDRVHVGQVFMDATFEEVDWTILRDRRRIAGDGIVVPVVALRRDDGTSGPEPEIMTRGFAPDGEHSDDELMAEARQAVVDSLRDATPEERRDEGLLKARLQTELQRFLRRRTQRKPLVIPVIVEF